MEARYDETCAICGSKINVGMQIHHHEALKNTHRAQVFVHDYCVGSDPGPTAMARLAKLAPLDAKTTRAVAMALGVTVSENKRYKDTGLIRFALSRLGVSDEQFQNAVNLATRAIPSPMSPPESHTAQVQAVPVNEVIKKVATEAAREYVETKVDEVVLKAADEVGAMVKEGEQLLKSAMTGAEARLIEQVKQGVIKSLPRELVVSLPDKEKVNVGVAHKTFDKLLQFCVAGVNVWLTGPAGSGKTTGAEQVAKALGRRFYFNGAIDTEYKLLGFVDAAGKVHSTAFREAFTNGGVYLFDEVDGSSASALLAFNAALANGACDFPGSTEPVPKHKDFICIAAANTWGTGATMEYVGRNKLDAAFLDRFVQIAWDYDEELELNLASNKEWAREVQLYRKAAKQKGLKVVVSPRASIYGSRLLSMGVPKQEVLQATLLAKMRTEDAAALLLTAQQLGLGKAA